MSDRYPTETVNGVEIMNVPAKEFMELLEHAEKAEREREREREVPE
jgi:hypothetical protein